MSYHADRGEKSGFEKNAFKVLSAFSSKSRAAKARTATCAHQTRRAVTFSTITLDL